MSNKRAQCDKRLGGVSTVGSFNERLVPSTNPEQNKSDLIESLLSETALNTREINLADPWSARDRC